MILSKTNRKLKIFCKRKCVVIKTKATQNNKDENVHRFAVRGKKRERKIKRERERDRERHREKIEI